MSEERTIYLILINPREVAAQALMEILTEDAYNNMTLQKILKKNGAMTSQDRGFVTEIVNGTLRNLTYIDWVINQFSKIKAEKMKPWICSVLRITIYQIGFMDKVPVSAACDEAVKLVRRKGYGALAGFTNGVLRTVSRKWNEISLPDEKKEPLEYLEIRYSHPKWLLKMWLHEYDYDFVKNLCRKNNESPDVTIACNTLKLSTEELTQKLIQEGVQVKQGHYLKNALHLSGTANLAVLESFQKGYFHVQDESSMLAVQVLDPQPGEKILDVCAAPGGKSLLAAEKMENRGQIFSRDIHMHKLHLIEETAGRLGIDIISIQQKDAAENVPEEAEQYDKVLIDAPCSGLGLIRKKPDIKRKKNGNDIDTLVEIQKRILAASADLVKEQGILVYSTCTICKKENNKNVEWFLNHYPYELCDMRTFLPKDIEQETTEKGLLQLFPHVHNTDGFFIARMRRKGQ